MVCPIAKMTMTAIGIADMTQPIDTNQDGNTFLFTLTSPWPNKNVPTKMAYNRLKIKNI
jgi:hypothetical protein